MSKGETGVSLGQPSDTSIETVEVKMRKALTIKESYRLPALIVMAAMLLISGCSSKSLPLPSSLEIPANDPSFRSRIYAGASFGSSKFDPDLTDAPAFSLAGDSGSATQMRIGYDMHNMLSLELDTSVLGEASVSAQRVAEDPSVKYTSLSVSALVYGINGVQNRSRREGLSAYARLGYSFINRSSAVIPLDTDNSAPVLGLGAEYGLKNGVGIRGEVTRFDSDAAMVSIGAIYRFGLSPSQIGTVIATAAEPALKTKPTHTTQGSDNLPVATTRHLPSSGLAMQTWAPRITQYDDDGDGVNNKIDRCAESSPNSTVGSDGCGLFDATLSDVVFKPGSIWLTPKARGQLDRLVETLLAFPEARIQVRAHTDNQGPADNNMSLSERRAESVVEYLQSRGIAELQLEALGLGETQPMDSNETAAGRKRNRRVEIATLSNVGSDTWSAVQASAKAEKPAKTVDIEAALAVAKPRTKTAKKRPTEPVFPTVPAIKLPALPKPGYVAGFTMDGVIDGVNFESDSAKLTSASKQTLDKLRDQLNAKPSVNIAVMAHTDDKGDADSNKKLSVSRALAVVDYLVAQGIKKPRLLPEGYGETLPLVQNVTDKDRARNRRIEVRIIR
jgi:outer membrane protein OmpA-like peptidoglycan-associated protein